MSDNGSRQSWNVSNGSRRPIHIDIGGEGRYPDAINVNPSLITSTTGEAGLPIPNLVRARGENLPFASHWIDILTVENTPLRTRIQDEIARVIKHGGQIRLLHPEGYAIDSGMHQMVISKTDGYIIQQFFIDNGKGVERSVKTVIHVP